MVYEQNPFEHTDFHNDRWIHRVSAAFPSNQAMGTYHLLNCGNDGYDQGSCKNHDGYAKNRAVISAMDVETMTRTQSANSPQPLMTAAAFCVWVMRAVLE